MADVGKAMVELFGSNRLGILEAVIEGPKRYSELSRELRVSEGELSRNLNRLVESGYLERHANGAFAPTPLARSLLAFVPGMRFLLENEEFARSHAFHELPAPFLHRIDDLAGARLQSTPLELFAGLASVFRSVERRFLGQWIIGATPFTKEQVELQGELARRILEKRAETRIVLLEKELPLYGSFTKPIRHLMQTRALAAAPTSMAISDTAALVGFNDREGEADFNRQFFGADPRFVQWCVDLFEHYWSRSAPVTVPGEAEPAPARVGRRAKPG